MKFAHSIETRSLRNIESHRHHDPDSYGIFNGRHLQPNDSTFIAKSSRISRCALCLRIRLSVFRFLYPCRLSSDLETVTGLKTTSLASILQTTNWLNFNGTSVFKSFLDSSLLYHNHNPLSTDILDQQPRIFFTSYLIRFSSGLNLEFTSTVSLHTFTDHTHLPPLLIYHIHLAIARLSLTLSVNPFLANPRKKSFQPYIRPISTF